MNPANAANATAILAGAPASCAAPNQSQSGDEYG
jgi:hypothetical protein